MLFSISDFQFSTNIYRFKIFLSADRYEDCGNVSDAAAYQNIENIKSGNKLYASWWWRRMLLNLIK